MGLFKKKPDPISERAQALNDQIAALEAEIKKLSVEQGKDDTPSAPPKAARNSTPRHPSSQPRLRSTALPHGHKGSTDLAPPEGNSVESQNHPAASPPEPVIEDINPFRPDAEPKATAAPRADLGVRRDDEPSWWERVKSNFRAQPTSNPKLVNYLAAGSIQGLRPLRYEKRVARNRFLLFVIALAIVLWGLVAVLLKR